ncbi:MAG: bifunctional DNA-formamidopyrimidine glycosylase/DNA-(apurinic or apyrimidinic site) lyase [Pseudomonadota bacterium]|nr:bifunctional DNA-formamidopyrimidine glycosylase/DNA-(apurinic or apyrimidinic site) lyase [Pseudomonadota bacterium]
MPELPEVETVRGGLAPHLESATLIRVIQNRPDLRFPLPQDFVHRLTGATITALRRRAKYLLAELSTGETLVAHLGMTGRFLIGETKPGLFHAEAGDDPKHTHIVLETEAGARIAFNDARRFGYMDLIRTDGLNAHPYFMGMGPEPLGPDFNARALGAALKGKKQNIKVTLLDQRIVAGLGNIYVSEALHRAHIHPERAAGSLKPAELKRLVAAVVTVLEEAITAGGSTLRDFRAADGELGYFQHRFRVYDREDAPCPTPNCKGVIRRIVQGGRSTFFCPVCQK